MNIYIYIYKCIHINIHTFLIKYIYVYIFNNKKSKTLKELFKTQNNCKYTVLFKGTT